LQDGFYIHFYTWARQNILTMRATNAWNQLPPQVVNTPSPNAFKARLDKAWSQ